LSVLKRRELESDRMKVGPPADSQLALTDERLRIIRDIAVTMDRTADKLFELVERLETLTKMYGFIISDSTQKLLEKEIHRALDEDRKRRKKNA
jgi:hypothetical protein